MIVFSHTAIAIYVAFALIIFFIIGFIWGRTSIKPSGRLIIDEKADEIFVAITDKPEDLVKKRKIVLQIFVNKGRSK